MFRKLPDGQLRQFVMLVQVTQKYGHNGQMSLLF
jgi:hypothetical protein